MKNQVFNPLSPQLGIRPRRGSALCQRADEQRRGLLRRTRHAGIVLHLPRRGRRGLYRVFYHVILANEKKLRAA